LSAPIQHELLHPSVGFSAGLADPDRSVAGRV